MFLTVFSDGTFQEGVHVSRGWTRVRRVHYYPNTSEEIIFRTEKEYNNYFKD